MNDIQFERRQLLQGLMAAGVLGMSGCSSLGGGASASKAQVVVVGGGYGGATVSKYIRLLSDYRIDVMMIEPNRTFVSCPMSNLVLGGQRQMADITNDYSALSGKHGVRVVHDRVASVDPAKRSVTLASGGQVVYDKLVIAPGIDMMWDSVQGLREARD